jgi:hypothetical protein
MRFYLFLPFITLCVSANRKCNYRELHCENKHPRLLLHKGLAGSFAKSKTGEEIMNIFTAHTQAQGVTYVEHLVFALRIAVRLFSSVIAFTLHAVFPFIGIRKELDLEATAAFILQQNDWIESQEKPAKRALAA